jgi:Flp pilus assembly protein TadG
MSRENHISKRTMSAMRHAVRRFTVGADGTAGAALVEFALLAPILIVMAVYTADIGLLVYSNMAVQNAAQAGAQYALELHNFGTPSYLSSISSAVTSAATITNKTVTISASPAPTQFCGCPTSTGVTPQACGTFCTGSPAGTYVTVSAAATYKTLIIPTQGSIFTSNDFTSSTYPLAASATVRVQ